MTTAFGIGNSNYHFTATGSAGGAALQVKTSLPTLPDGWWYERYDTPGPKFDAAAANKSYSNVGRSVGEYLVRPTITHSDYGLRGGYATATVGVRTCGYVKDADGNKTTVRGSWSTKTCVADPQFFMGENVVNADYSISSFYVEIPALEGATSYTVYLGKRKSGTSSVTGWKAVGTFAANEGKTTYALVDNYGGKKLAKRFYSNQEWAVKVVTHTPYGSSPGEFWRSYDHGDLILHEGMIY